MGAVFREVVAAHQSHVVVQVVHPDHGGEDLILVDVRRVGHQYEVVFPQEKGRGEKTARVEREQVVIVEELGVLTLGPFPDVQVIELPLGKLDGH